MAVIPSPVTVAAGSAPGLQLVYADQIPGVDHTGAADSSAAVRAKQATLGAAPYVLVFGAGTYDFGSGSPFANLGLDQSVQAQGQNATQFNWAGAGPLITVVEPGVFNGSHRAGRLSGFSIVGPFGAGGTAGVKYANLQSLQIDDVGFFGLDGGAILGFKSGGTGFAEEAVFTRLTIVQCGATTGYSIGYNGTSFDYSLINAVVVNDPGVSVIDLANNAQLAGLDLSLRGNLHGGSSNTGAVIAIDRGNASGTSYVKNAKFAVTLEEDTGTGSVGHFLLWMDSTNSASQFKADGVFNILNAGVAPQGTHNPNFLPASFNGISLDPSGGAMTDGDAVVVQGGTCYTPANASFGALFAGNVFPQFGDVIAFQLVNGANTLVFNGVNGFARQFTAMIQQPGSGAAGTVVWPGSVKWPAGTPPTLSSTNGFVDKVRFVYVPATGFHYGNLDGVHYS